MTGPTATIPSPGIPSITLAFQGSVASQANTDLQTAFNNLITKIQEANNRHNISNNVGAQFNDRVVRLAYDVAKELS